MDRLIHTKAGSGHDKILHLKLIFGKDIQTIVLTIILMTIMRQLKILSPKAGSDVCIQYPCVLPKSETVNKYCELYPASKKVTGN